MFPKKEIYHVWITADELLDKGEFDEAIRLYKSHLDQPSFVRRIKEVNQVKAIVEEAKRLQKRRQFPAALEKFKEYRKFSQLGSVKSIELAIEGCLTEINKIKSKDLDSKARIITGFEFVHQGRKKLALMDTIGANQDFITARKLGANKNSILKEQYTEGFNTLQKLVIWGKDYQILKSKQPSSEELLGFLQTYKNIPTLYLPSIESEIREIQVNLKGVKSLAEVVRLCDGHLMESYLKKNEKDITAPKYLLDRLRDINSTRSKIEVLKQNFENTATIESAFLSLSDWVEEFPDEIKPALIECLKIEKSGVYLELSKQAISAGNRQLALQLSQKAQQEGSQSELEEYIQKLISTTSCIGRKDFERGVENIRKELANCNLVRLRSYWEQNMSYVKDCSSYTQIVEEYRMVKDSIELMIKSDSLLKHYRNQLQLNKSNCQEKRRIYEQMNLLNVCDPVSLNSEITSGLTNMKNCGAASSFNFLITLAGGGITPQLKIQNSLKKVEIGSNLSAGFEVAWNGQNNDIISLVLGMEYMHSNFTRLESTGSLSEDFTLKGANGLLAVKIMSPRHQSGKMRPYLKLGTELYIPLNYHYENHSTLTTVTSKNEIQKSVLSLVGAAGLELQRPKFGMIIEFFGGYGLGSIYNSNLKHISTTGEDVDLRIHKVGLRTGFRFW